MTALDRPRAGIVEDSADGGALALGLDIGGTKLAAGVMNSHGELRSFVRMPTPAERRPDDVLRALFQLGRKALAECGIATADLIGIGCGGPVDTASGVVDEPPNLPGWSTVPVAALAHEEFGRPVRLENDAVAGALGEYRFGSAQKSTAMAFLTISTGVGGAVILNGEPMRGRTGNGGELGHMIVVHNGRPCNCGSAGCLEAYVSGTSIAAAAAEGLAEGAPSSLPARPTAADVSAAAAAGDEFAGQLWDFTVGVLGSGVASLINVFEPDLVVLGGGVTGAGQRLLGPVRDRARRLAFGHDTEVCLAQFGDTVGVVGAAASAFEAASQGEFSA